MYMQLQVFSPPATRSRSEVWRLFRGFQQLPGEDQQMLRNWFRVPEAAEVFTACELIEGAAPLEIRERIKFLGASAFLSHGIQ
jgi:hypothetical protein